METYFLKDDIKLICVTSTSFPGGITAAHEKLHRLLTTTNGRNLYGISSPQGKGEIVYRAAVEESFTGEAEQLKLETFTLKKGEYTGSRVVNYPDHMESISNTFQKILQNPRIDPQGCCVEKYLNEKDVQCMVRLEPKLKR